jgi:ABC-type uncharacterized transport system substrate-binding protein
MTTILAMAVGPTRDVDIRDSSKLDNVRPYIDGLVTGLGNFNRRLGSDFDIDYREREPKDLAPGANAIAAFKPKNGGSYDLIFAMSTTVVRGAQSVPSYRPIVYPSISDRKNDGLTSKNSTGVSARRSQTAGACFEHFLATVLTLKRVRVLHRPGYPPSERALKLVQEAADKRGVAVTGINVQSEAQIEAKLNGLPKRDPTKPPDSGVLPLPIDICFSAASTIIDVAQGQKNLPVFFPTTDWVKAKLPSALGGYGVSQRKCGELTADFVNQILWNKKKPDDLRVKDVTSADFEWAISRAAAQALNIPLVTII